MKEEGEKGETTNLKERKSELKGVYKKCLRAWMIL